jgi:hypothetical protein
MTCSVCYEEVQTGANSDSAECLEERGQGELMVVSLAEDRVPQMAMNAPKRLGLPDAPLHPLIRTTLAKLISVERIRKGIRM